VNGVQRLEVGITINTLVVESKYSKANLFV